MISVAGIFPPGPNSVSVTGSHPTTATRPIDIEALEQLALNLMANGLAASTRRTYTTAQRRFVAFCYQTKQLAPSGFPCPASERTLMLFAAHLADSMKANSIKVYMAGVRSLHVEQGFPNPLDNRLRLERVLRGIKRTQGSEKRDRRPVTISVLRKL